MYDAFTYAQQRSQTRLYVLDMTHDMHGVEAGSDHRSARCVLICTASRPEVFLYVACETWNARRRGRKRLQMCKMCRHVHGVKARSVSICCLRTRHGMHGVKAGSVCRCARCVLICTSSRPEAFLYVACETWNARRRGGKHLQMCKMCSDMHVVKARSISVCCVRDMECTASRQEASADA